MDAITLDTLMGFANRYPNYAITLNRQFLLAHGSYCGFVPNNWNGRCIYLTDEKHQKELNAKRLNDYRMRKL